MLLRLLLGGEVGLDGFAGFAEGVRHADFVLNLGHDGIWDFGDADVFQAVHAVGVEESRFACLVKGVGSAADTGQGDVLVEYGVAERDDSEC